MKVDPRIATGCTYTLIDVETSQPVKSFDCESPREVVV
jgi:hypothetical protein